MIKSSFISNGKRVPNSGVVDQPNNLPRRGWTKADDSGWIFCLISSGGRITRFWGEGDENMPKFAGLPLNERS